MAQQAGLSYDRNHSNNRRKQIRITRPQGEIIQKLLQLALEDHDIRKAVSANYDLTRKALAAVTRDLGKPDKPQAVPAQGENDLHAS